MEVTFRNSLKTEIHIVLLTVKVSPLTFKLELVYTFSIYNLSSFKIVSMQTRGRSGWEVAKHGGPEFRARVLHEKIYGHTQVNFLRPISSSWDGGVRSYRDYLEARLHHNYVSGCCYCSYYSSKERSEALLRKRRRLYQGTRDKRVIEIRVPNLIFKWK